jgi:hypothetical protein
MKKVEQVRVEFLYNFVGGGWNSEFATSKEEAYQLAVKRWKGSETLIVDKESIRSSTPTEYNNLMSLFY